MKTREISRIIPSHRQTEGGGFIVRRPFPNASVVAIDPFLLIDEMGPIDYAPGKAIGAPDHPHRGFETVTYMLEGESEHEDSAGHRGVLKAGDVQWMTAGAGIVHSEMPSKRIQSEGGRTHGFQIWVNLPKSLKMSQPRYQELSSAQIPAAKTADGLAEVKVIAGEALGAKAAINTLTPIVYQDWTVKPGADLTVPLAPNLTAMVFVFEGDLKAGDDGREIRDGFLGVFGAGEAVRLRGGSTTARVLLLAGEPLQEPIARYGPFVMNTEQELIQAFADYETGKMGEITRTARIG